MASLERDWRALGAPDLYYHQLACQLAGVVKFMRNSHYYARLRPDERDGEYSVIDFPASLLEMG
jgi:hypothetical protein